MRRTHLRGHGNILKRALVHVSGFNLGLVMRRWFGVGTPRGLQGRVAAVVALVVSVLEVLRATLRGLASPSVAINEGHRAANPGGSGARNPEVRRLAAPPPASRAAGPSNFRAASSGGRLWPAAPSFSGATLSYDAITPGLCARVGVRGRPA
jgi:hypothetical protein